MLQETTQLKHKPFTSLKSTKPVITFRQAIVKANDAVNAGGTIKTACDDVFDKFTVMHAKVNHPMKSAKNLRDNIYSFRNRLVRRRKRSRKAKLKEVAPPQRIERSATPLANINAILALSFIGAEEKLSLIKKAIGNG